MRRVSYSGGTSHHKGTSFVETSDEDLEHEIRVEQGLVLPRLG